MAVFSTEVRKFMIISALILQMEL